MNRLRLVLLFAVVLLVPSISSAQEEETSAAEMVAQTFVEPTSIPEGAVDCFDYYTFNSVQVDVSASLASTVPGVPMTFSGMLGNDNPYPVTDGSVFVKVFQMDVGGNTQANGYPVVDAFFAAEDLSIPANGEVPFSFDWSVPRYLPSGDYEIATYFLVGKKFNLLGLSFTDDVTGNRASFSVVSDAPEVPAFDKSAVTLNDEPYAFAAFTPQFGKDETVNVDVVLENPSNESRTVDVVWTLHNWSAEMEGSELDMKSETVTLAPGERKSLRYVADPALSTGSVTLLSVVASYEDTQSILGIRFSREGFEEMRLNYPGLMKYPVRAGEENTIFSCLHATSAGLVEDAKLTLTLTDSFGIVLDSHVYEGPISGAMMATKHDFTPKVSSSTFTLSAKLEKNGKTIETYETTYDCEALDASLCPMNVSLSPIASVKNALSTSSGTRALFAIFLIVPLGLIVWLLSKRGKGGMAVLALLFGFGALLSATPAEAKSTVWNSGNIGDLCFESDDEPNQYADAWFVGITNPSASVLYQVTLTDADTGMQIPDSAMIPVGTRIKLTPKTPENTDICWFGTGNDTDTPFGYWRSSGSAPSNAEIMTTANSIFYGLYTPTSYFSDKIRIYAALSVNPSTVSYSHSGTAGLSCSGDGALCTVTSAGSIQASANFSATYGKFYRKWKFFDLPLFPSAIFRSLVTEEEMENGGGSNLPGRRCSDVNENWQLTVPAQTLSFNLTAVGGNNAPATPALSGPTSGASGTVYDFTATATDPDGDAIRYQFDWNNDGTADQYAPASGTIASGTPATLPYAWIGDGSYTIRARAVDANGSVSGWATHAIAIATPSGSLTLCQYGSPLPTSVLLFVGDTRSLTAHYGWNGDCSDMEVTPLATWSENASSNVVSLSGSSPKTVAANALGTEAVSASYSGASDGVDFSVSAPCTYDCQSETHCSNQPAYTVTDSCGNDRTCSGTRSCGDMNWKEAVPGF